MLETSLIQELNEMKENKEEVKSLYIKASEVEPKEVRWLWYPYIPYGKVTIVQGIAGDGKSTMLLTLSAKLTTGSPLPFYQEAIEPMTVIYQTTEDDKEDTVVPRFIKAGGDRERLIFIKEDERSLTFADSRIRKVIDDTGARLLILDPCSSYIGKCNVNASNEVRPEFNHLIDTARETGCAIVVIDHLNKNEMQSVLMRNNGSVDKIGAARSVITIIRDKDDRTKRYFVQTKANLAPMGYGIVFSVGENGIEFLEEIEADADELMSRFTTSVFGRPDSRLQEAMDFISGMLADGRLPAKECEAKLREAGICSGTAKKAKKRLGVVSTKPGLEWFWSMPDQD